VPRVGNLIHQTTTGTGTSNLTLAPVNGKRSFNTEFGTGGTDVFDYFISSRTAAEWEIGTGHLSDSTTLVRDTVVASSNSNEAVNFGEGTKDVTNFSRAANLMVLDAEDQGPIAGGADVTSKSLGTISSGTVTPDPGDRQMQHYTNDGAHTLAPHATKKGSFYLDITNGASAGAITTSGWTKVTGDSFTTTNGHKFRCICSLGNGGSLLQVQALQ
jgi:hypothetical protein